MYIDLYTFLVFLHVILFAYWLGPDWGVFVCARRVANESLSREERLHFLKASVEVDVLPRTSIALIIAVGMTLAYIGNYASMTAFDIWMWWGMTVLWVALIWLTGYILKPGPLKTNLDKAHMWLRHIVSLILVAFGIASLVWGAPMPDTWLAVKMLLIALLLTGGSMLRVIVASWVAELTTAEGSQAYEKAKGTIARTYPNTRKLAYLFWATTISIGFLGVTQPF